MLTCVYSMVATEGADNRSRVCLFNPFKLVHSFYNRVENSPYCFPWVIFLCPLGRICFTYKNVPEMVIKLPILETFAQVLL